MKVIIKKDYDEMSEFVADEVARLVQAKPQCVLGLATGSTPAGTYARLAKWHQKGLDFSSVTTFNLDEYFGLGFEINKEYALDQSYARFMYEELFKKINIKKENIHLPDGLSSNPEAFCIQYEQNIKDVGGIDLQLLGIGGDGHWAFNEPGSSLSSRTRLVDLASQTIEDNYESFFKKAGFQKKDVPHQAISMGIGTILEARQLIMMASGVKKANVIAQALQGPITDEITASAIQLFTGEALVVLDEAAASQLK